MSGSVNSLRLEVYDVGIKDPSLLVVQLYDEGRKDTLAAHYYRWVFLYRELDGVADVATLIIRTIHDVESSLLSLSLKSVLGSFASPVYSIFFDYDVYGGKGQVASYAEQLLTLLCDRQMDTLTLQRGERQKARMEKIHQCAMLFSALMLVLPSLSITFFYRPDYFTWIFPIDDYLDTKETKSSFIALPYQTIITL